jgi:hypothetical protein
MAQSTITLDDIARRFPGIDTAGDNLGEIVDKLNTMFAELYSSSDGSNVKLTGDQTIGGTKTFSNVPVLPATALPLTLLSSVVTVSSAELLALNATPKDIIAAPAAGNAIIVEKAEFFLDYNSAAYAGIAAGEDLALRYTNGSGAIALQCEATGFLDATADAFRVCTPSNDVNVTAAGAAKLVLHMTTGEIITGNSPLKVRVWYRIIPLLT